jgi:hypothetical protein
MISNNLFYYSLPSLPPQVKEQNPSFPPWGKQERGFKKRKFLEELFCLKIYLKFRQSFTLTIVIISLLMSSCHSGYKNQGEKPLFTLLDKKHTHIDFENKLEYTEEFNTYTYRNFYNGAGMWVSATLTMMVCRIYIFAEIRSEINFISIKAILFLRISQKRQACLAPVHGQQVSA